MKALTQAELKEVIFYDATTGNFFWLEPKRGKKMGVPAGTPHFKGYIIIRINGCLYLAHRLAFLFVYNVFPKDQVDHINGIRNDNRIVNIRHATNSENQLNRWDKVKNTSGYKGIVLYKGRIAKPWRAKADLNGNPYHLGYYVTALEASLAYQKFAKAHHGEFLNIK